MLYFADTNILLRFLNRADPDYTVTRAAVRIIKARGDDVTTAAQNIAEFWNVLTRPVIARGGYGLSVTDAERRLPFIERHFPLLPDHAAAYFEWKRLVLSQDDFFCSHRQPKKPSNLGAAAKIVCDKMNLTMHWSWLTVLWAFRC